MYVDDMLVKSLLAEQHLTDLNKTFQTLRRHKIKLNPSKCTFEVSAGKFLMFFMSQRGIKANPKKVKALIDMQPSRNTKEV